MEASTIGVATAAPTIAPPQHMLALKRANEVRLGHASLKRDIAAGRITFAAALTDPRACGRISVADLLRAQRRWGVKRARKFLFGIPLSEMKRADSLTERQRLELVAAFPRA